MSSSCDAGLGGTSVGFILLISDEDGATLGTLANLGKNELTCSLVFDQIKSIFI